MLVLLSDKIGFGLIIRMIEQFIKSPEVFSYILEGLHNGIILIDNNKNVLFANKIVTDMFGLCSMQRSDNSIIGNFLNCEYDCTACKGCNLDLDIKSFFNNFECKMKINDCFSFTNKQGETKYFKYSIMPINNTKEFQFLIAFDDITEEKALYKDLELKHFRLQMLTESLENSDSIILAVANSVEAKDKLTKGHISRVAYFAEQIGKKFNMTEKELETLKKGAILHDIGKIGTPDNVLNKPGPLNDEEFEIMKKHPYDGWKILKAMKTFKDIANVVRHHHEKLDGSGYPDGIKGNDIDIFTRIVAIVDIYDALISERPYRKPMTREQALDIIFKDVNNGKLDREVANALAEMTVNENFSFDEEEY